MSQKVLDKSGENLEATIDYVLGDHPEDMTIGEKSERRVKLSDYEMGKLAEMAYHETFVAQMKTMTREERDQAKQFVEAVRGLGELVVTTQTYPIVDDPRLEVSGWYGSPLEGRIN